MGKLLDGNEYESLIDALLLYISINFTYRRSNCPLRTKFWLPNKYRFSMIDKGKCVYKYTYTGSVRRKSELTLRPSSSTMNSGSQQLV